MALGSLTLGQYWNTSSLTNASFSLKNKGYTLQLDIQTNGNQTIETTQKGKLWRLRRIQNPVKHLRWSILWKGLVVFSHYLFSIKVPSRMFGRSWQIVLPKFLAWVKWGTFFKALLRCVISQFVVCICGINIIQKKKLKSSKHLSGACEHWVMLNMKNSYVTFVQINASRIFLHRIYTTLPILYCFHLNSCVKILAQ